VKKLLDLKKQLADSQGQDAPQAGGGKKKGKDSKQAPVKQEATGTALDSAAVEKLTAQVTEQVRFLITFILYLVRQYNYLIFQEYMY